MAAAETTSPASADDPAVLDADAKGNDDPKQTIVTVNGVDPTVSNPRRLSEPSAATAVGAALSGGSDSAPQGGLAPGRKSPSDPVGVSRAIQFGGTSIYELDAESPMGEHGEDSLTLWRSRFLWTQVAGTVPCRWTFAQPTGPIA